MNDETENLSKTLLFNLILDTEAAKRQRIAQGY